MYLTSVIAKVNVLTFCAIEVMLCDCFFIIIIIIIIIIIHWGLWPLFSDCREMG
jgi:hypothetical protein